MNETLRYHMHLHEWFTGRQMFNFAYFRKETINDWVHHAGDGFTLGAMYVRDRPIEFSSMRVSR